MNPRHPMVPLALAAALLGGACDDEKKPATPKPGGTPAQAAPTGGASTAKAAPLTPFPTFTDMSVSAGVTPGNHTGKPAQKDWIVSGMGGGSIILDYNNDGLMDLCVVDGTMLTEAGELEFDDNWRTRLFRNEGDWKFTDVTKEAGIDVKAFGFGGASADFNADGFTDIYVCTWGRNYLLQNRGDGTFVDVSAEAGVLGGDKDMSTACAWGDLNGDGWLDLYVSNYIDQWAWIEKCREEGLAARSAEFRGFKVYAGPPGLPPQADRLYFGGPDGTFKDVSAVNLTNQVELRFAFQPIMTDVDNDGDLDIYVANDTNNNSLWVNDGTGMLTDRGVDSGVAFNGDVRMQAGMGVDAADLNRDGRIDLAVTNFSHDYNTLHLNQTRRQDQPLFLDSTHQLNGATVSYRRLCWGLRLADLDNDGHLDMFVACGHVYGEIDHFAERTGTSYEQRNLVLRGLGPPRFQFADVTDDCGDGLQVKRVFRGAAFADFDNDGDQDVWVTSLNGKPVLLRNDGGNGQNFAVFRLEGKGGLRDPSGARVRVELANGTKLLQELHNGASFCSDNDPRLFFGVGGEKTLPRVTVIWPGGEEQTFENVTTRRFYFLRQGEAELTDESPKDLR